MAASSAECILFAVDASHIAESTLARGVSCLDIFKRSCIFFAQAKRRVNSRHLFGLIAVRDRAELVLPPTKDLDRFSNTVQQLQPSRVNSSTLELGSLVDATIRVQGDLPIDPIDGTPRIRVLFLYARSATLPVLTEHIGAPLAIDVIYMHEKPVAGVNCPQEVFQALEEHCDALAQRANHAAYILPGSTSSLDSYFNNLVWMLAHPGQRLPQDKLFASLRFNPPTLNNSSASAGSTRAPTPSPSPRPEQQGT